MYMYLGSIYIHVEPMYLKSIAVYNDVRNMI